MELTPQESGFIPSLPTISAAPNHLAEFNQFVESASASAARIIRDDRPETLRAWLDLAEAYRITQALRECSGNRDDPPCCLGCEEPSRNRHPVHNPGSGRSPVLAFDGAGALQVTPFLVSEGDRRIPNPDRGQRPRGGRLRKTSPWN